MNHLQKNSDLAHNIMQTPVLYGWHCIGAGIQALLKLWLHVAVSSGCSKMTGCASLGLTASFIASMTLIKLALK